MWSAEIKELKKLYQTFQGQHPKLDKELDKLIITDDENMALVYARRSLEVMITDLCETELDRPRGTEPLRGIIDKLNKEEKVPHNIVVSMQNLNSLSSFGAHPKDFDPRQVKPVLLDLTTVLDWYLKHLDSKAPGETDPDAPQEKRKEPVSIKKASGKSGKRIILLSAGVFACTIIILALLFFDIIGSGKKTLKESIGSIVVLPFSNFTGSDTLEYFVNGMHSSLIQDMGKIGSLRTIGSTSSKMYKDVNMSVTQIASELNVEGALEIAIVCFGEDSICWQARLIKAGKEEKQIWVQDFKEDKSKILHMYNQITKQIAEELKIELTDNEEHLLAGYETVDPEALDAYLKGQYYWEMIDRDSFPKALAYFQLATKIEPEWADPYVGLASAWGMFSFFEVLPRSTILPMKYKYLNKALELNPNSAKAHYGKALNTVWSEWDWEQGEKEFLKTLELNPNDALSRLHYAHLLMILRRNDEAVYQANLGLALDPLKPIILGLYGMVMSNEGDYQSSIQSLEKALSIDPNNRWALGVLLPMLYLNGDYEKWIETWIRKVSWSDEAKATVVNVFHEKGHLAAIEKMFTLHEKYAPDDCFMSDGIKATRYSYLKKYEKALDYIEKLYEKKSTSISYIATNMYNYELKNNPRYIELLKKMNLPLPEK